LWLIAAGITVAPALASRSVAVRIRLDDLARPDDAGAAWLVLDDHRLAKFRPQAFRDDAGNQIGRSAGRERRYQGDRPRWVIVLRDRRRGETGQQQNCKASQHVTIPPVGSCGRSASFSRPAASYRSLCDNVAMG
jgi:hypothetical protein